jgi:glycosyltransferase involved in cell wall biosynthesis
MHWVVAAPFFREGQSNRWLIDFVPGSRHCFTSVAPPPEVESSRDGGETTRAEGWKRFWKQSGRVFDLAPEGIVTIFPQLPVMCGLRKRLGRRKVKIVAWCFNLGRFYGGLKGMISRMALDGVDRFVCHSSGEVMQYSRWLKIPAERFSFVPLQRGRIHVTHEEDRQEPFIVALGSARRDYATLFAAVGKLGLPTVVVAAPYAVAGLAAPKNVTWLQGLSREECLKLAQRARLSVVPILNGETASGQVTVVDAMSMSCPLVATRCIGTRDYVEHEKTGLLVDPSNPDAMAASIMRMWHDEALRSRLGAAAGQFAQEHLSDEAAGRALGRILDEVSQGRS